MRQTENNSEASKRSLLIAAIASGDTKQLQALAHPGRQVVVLNTFLDGLMYTSSANADQQGTTVIETENFKSMISGLKSSKHPA